MSNHRSIGFYWRYNPLLNKPTSLEPLMPWGSYYYYGPDPAAGCSYGLYRDEETGMDVLSTASEKVYSPATGKEMKKVSDAPYDEIKAMLSKMTSSKGIHRVKCTACNMPMTSNLDFSEMDKAHCTACGKGIMGEDAAKMGETKTMATQNIVNDEKRVAALKERIKANIQKKREAAATAKAEAATGEKSLAEKLREKVLARRAEKALAEEKEDKEEKKAEPKAEGHGDEPMEELHEEEKKEDAAEGAEEYVSLDSIMEAMEEEEDAEPKAEGHGDEPMEELHEEEKKEDAAEAPKAAGEDEEYMDLDMVLSMLKRKARVAKARARIKARREERKAAEAAAKAATAKAPVKAEEEKKEEPKVAEEAPKAKAEEKKEEPKAEEKKEEAPKPMEAYDEAAPAKPAEPGMQQPENPLPAAAEEDKKEEKEEMDKKESEAMRFEPLAAVDNLKDISREDIDMMLYDESGENPTWNVSVAGVPTCRIQLKSQASAEDIRKVFTSDDYALDLIEHCVKSGFAPTMKKVNAEFWANTTSDKKIADRYQSMASTAIEQEKAKILASFRNDFMACLKVATAGLNKNFYPELGNPLKDQLFGNLNVVGLPEQTAISVIEKSFAEGSAEYFNTLFDKATEYMNMSREARAEIANAISATSSLDHYNDRTVQDAPATLADRMAAASVTAAANLSGPAFNVNKAVSMDTEDYKAQLKKSWKKR